MSETGVDGADMADIGELPTGTVTLLLADIEGSTRLWETQPEAMRPAVERLDQVLADAVATHHGVRPVEQGEGDSFVVAFARAADAVLCALELQRAPLAPIRLRIGVHTGDVQLRDEGNYIGPTINRAARLRDLGHGGQTVLSGSTEPLVVDHLPDEVTLTDLGTHPLRDLPRPERVVQLCHPDLHNEFPPLRTTDSSVAEGIPVPLTSFIGRQAEMAGIRAALREHRLVTLTGAGGAGKTRLAIEVAAAAASAFADGVCFVDLAPITQPDMVAVTAERALGLPDQPGRQAVDVLRRFLRDREALIVLDNCEHLLDAGAELITALLTACPAVMFLTTSREPIGVPGEVSWRVPSLSLADEAIELFGDRARRVRPDFRLDADNLDTVTDICRRLDGLPLAIELAAARVRALSPNEIRDSLHDTFRLLTGGARTAVRRQQTLRASVDWSHALLTEPEQVLFRRLAVFAGGFDLDAALAVGADSDVQRYQLLDQLSLLVDKSLVAAYETGTDTGTGMRYRLMETVRQYAAEKLGESGESADVRTRHRDHYTVAAAEREARGHAADEELVAWAQVEIDNLRTAFAWSQETGELQTALQLIVSLRPLWLLGGRGVEALAGLAAILADEDHASIAPAVWVGAVAQQAIIAVFLTIPVEFDRTQQALALARQLDDPALVTRALIACGMAVIYSPDMAQQYFAEAIALAGDAEDRWSLCEIFSYQATVAILIGEPMTARSAAEAGRDLADALGDRFYSRNNRTWLGSLLWFQGELAHAGRVFSEVIDEAEAAADLHMALFGYTLLCGVLAFQGRSASAYDSAQSALATSRRLGGTLGDAVHAGLAYAALAAGDATVARRATEEALSLTIPAREIFTRSAVPAAEAALADGDLTAARHRVDDCLEVASGCYRMAALTVRAFIAIAGGEPGQAERDAHDALAIAARTGGYLRVADTLECLARLADGNAAHAARLLGAADAIRQRMGHVRFPTYQEGYDTVVAAVREALGQNTFNAAWAEGAALSTEEAIGYAQRGRGGRKRPATGWASLTPTELDVARLVSEGLSGKDIAARLFVSPRTVQTHLTHIYAKLGVSSRVQLAQEVTRQT